MSAHIIKEHNKYYRNMKKMMIAAMLVATASTAFAQDAFKQMSKVKDYAEAEKILKDNLGSLSAEQKAKCYNYLIDLAMDKITKEQAIETQNQMDRQLKKDSKSTPYDTTGLYNAVYNAIADGVECYKYDQMENDKGKVKPKFTGLGEKLYGYRPHLINGGVHFQNSHNDALAYKNLAYYVESASFPMFAEQAAKAKDENLTQIAYLSLIHI